MAAINGSTGPASVEYHEKPTGTQLNLVQTSLGNANPVPLRVLFYLTSRVRGTKVSKIFTVIFGGKGRDIACTQQHTKKSVKDCKIENFSVQKLAKVLCRFAIWCI